MPFKIIRNDITKVKADAIVNTANPMPTYGSGTDCAIYEAAGAKMLLSERAKIGYIAPGDIAVTSAFKLNAKYIIHAVGPVWHGGNRNEAELLYNAYKQSLILAKENNCHSIGFPVISSGIYGYPKDEAWKIAVQACNDFINENSDYSINIIFAVLSHESKELGEKTIAENAGL